MELDVQQPTHILHSREWSQATAGPSASSQFHASPSQRRRSSAAHSRPAAPPPAGPIPRIPVVPEMQHEQQPADEQYRAIAFSRQTSLPSPNLAAVAAFSQSRLVQNHVDDLSDPPPQSFLPPPPDPQPDPPQPPESHPNRPPSSRRALTRALELAREAVQLDATNDHPEEAVMAYGRSVALLSEVMERVRRGESSEVTGRRKNGRRRSASAQEEEVRRLQSIHDTYADRMNILSIAYSIPPLPYTTSSIYSSISMSTGSTSPTTSISPSSDTADHPLQTPIQENLHQDPDVEDSGMEAIGAAMFIRDLPSPAQTTSNPSAHPYAAAFQYEHPAQAYRASIQQRRPRGVSSSLPPALPPPISSPPPAPASTEVKQHLDVGNRQRGDSVLSHRRNLSGSRLAALEEEYDDLVDQQWPGHHEGMNRHSKHLLPDTPRKLESPPLPPLPSPTATQPPTTPRNAGPPASKPPPSPRLSSIVNNNVIVPRPRGSSQVQPMINSSIDQGSIIQRRAKSSVPPTPRSSSPADSVASAGSIPLPKPNSAALPGNTTGRSRSSSQPGRRPSLVGGRLSPIERPPLPSSAGANGPVQRKTSFPSKFNPNAPLQLTVQTDIAGPNFQQSLAPPSSSILPTVLPTTPISPLPPLPPNDPMRKPYHLMNLLRTTMVSGTGGYITRRLHVPQEVWSQGGAKLNNLIEKIRVVGILCTALEDIQVSSSEYFGAGNVSSGMGLGIGSIGRKEGEAWIARLEEFSNVCDGVVANFGKKLGVGEGFVVKKTTWGDKLGRRFDKFTNGKNLDSPAAYVQGLRKLFEHAQLLDEHAKAVTSQPIAPAYSSFSLDIRSAAEIKLKRSSEFFASVVLTFVIRDLSQLLDKYVKKCEKWMAE